MVKIGLDLTARPGHVLRNAAAMELTAPRRHLETSTLVIAKNRWPPEAAVNPIYPDRDRRIPKKAYSQRVHGMQPTIEFGPNPLRSGRFHDFVSIDQHAPIRAQRSSLLQQIVLVPAFIQSLER